MNLITKATRTADATIDMLDNPVKGTSFKEKVAGLFFVVAVAVGGMLSQPTHAAEATQKSEMVYTVNEGHTLHKDSSHRLTMQQDVFIEVAANNECLISMSANYTSQQIGYHADLKLYQVVARMGFQEIAGHGLCLSDYTRVIVISCGNKKANITLTFFDPSVKGGPPCLPTPPGKG